MTALPDGWARATLGDFMVERGGSVNPAKFPDEEFELYSIPAHDGAGFEVIRGADIGSSKRVVEPCDVMVSKIVPHIQRARIVGPLGVHRQIASTEWISFRSDAHNPRFLRYFLLSDEFHRQFMGTVSGVGGSLNRAQPARVKPITLPIPPMEEQHRIVELLEDHLSRLDAADSYIDVALRRVQAWQASLLDSAIWNQSATTRAVSELLREPMRNGRSDRAVQSGTGGTRTLTLTAVTRARFVEEFTKLTTTKPEVAKGLWLEPGDIFVQRSNTPELVGTAARYDGPSDWAIFPDLLIRLRADEKIVDSRYLTAALRSERTHRSLRAKAKGLAGSMPKIDQNAVGGTKVPVPSLDLQREVVEQLELVHGVAAALTSALQRQRRRTAALRRSLLGAAFSGHLTSPRLSVVAATIGA